VKQMGGTTIVQDPYDAMFPGMPQSALNYVDADHVVPLSEIPQLLVRVTATRTRPIASSPRFASRSRYSCGMRSARSRKEAC